TSEENNFSRVNNSDTVEVYATNQLLSAESEMTAPLYNVARSEEFDTAQNFVHTEDRISMCTEITNFLSFFSSNPDLSTTHEDKIHTLANQTVFFPSEPVQIPIQVLV
ncbi:1649_t:CDS:1, partial [Racocetra persica]